MRRTISVLVTLLMISPQAMGAFEILSHEVLVDAEARETTFTLTFNQPTDFFGVDAFGRENHAFQYFYDTRPDPLDLVGPDVVIIRGGEIRFNNDIPIRESVNETGQELPNAQGWGPVRGASPFELDGQSLTFTAAWEHLGESDGQFAYRLIALDNGSTTTNVTSQVIPLPPAAGAGLAALVLALLLGSDWRRGGLGRFTRTACSVSNQ